VAVLAIDPSSAINKGSILGIKPEWKNLQKKKMHLSDLPRVLDFWGSSQYNFETMMICEAAGYDYILIETVGVGQSEVLVADITDVFYS
jgi:LAO/AO transport system kinase